MFEFALSFLIEFRAYYRPSLGIPVKSDAIEIFAGLVSFWELWYIMDLNRASLSKLMAVWIFPRLPCPISSGAIYDGPQSSIPVKNCGWLNLPRLPSSILSIPIYDGPQLVILVKSCGCSKFLRASLFDFEHCDVLLATIGYPCQNWWPFKYNQCFLVQFWALWYIMGPNQASLSKLMVVWICPWLPCSILSVAIHDGPQSGIPVKSCGCSNLPRASFFDL